MERESLIFYRSFYEATKDLPDELRLEVYDAILGYGIVGLEGVNLSPLAKAVFTLIKPQIDANNRKYINGKKGADSGKKGGRPKQGKSLKNNTLSADKNNDKTPKGIITETPQEPQENPNETPKEKEKDKDIYKEILSNDSTKKKISLPNPNDETISLNTEKEKEKSCAKKETLEHKQLACEKRKTEFLQEITPFTSQYPSEMCKAFFSYWSELNKSKTKMRFESEKTWEIARRLATWHSRDRTFTKPKAPQKFRNEDIEEYTNTID